MSDPRELYVPPKVLRFDFTIDPRVTLASTCKDLNAATGAARAGCVAGLSASPCSDISPS